MFRPLIVTGAIVLALYPASAQQPSAAQRDAIRAACRSDFMANCSDVTPGGKEALECLLRNQTKLSSACNRAVSEIAAPKSPPSSTSESPASPAASAPTAPTPAAEQAAPKSEGVSEGMPEPAPKTAAGQEAQLKAVRQSCTLNDFMAHCSWIKPDNPELLLCLQANSADLSPACQSAVQGSPPPAAQSPAPAPAPEKKQTKTPSKKSIVSHAPAAEPAAPPAAAPTAPAQPTEAQKSAIRAACRSDFMANCSGVQPGGAAALQCLQSHSAKLSSACQSAVAAISGGGSAGSSSGAAGAAAPAAGAPTAAVAPLGPIPPMRPREALGILATCRAEHETLCGDVPLGGGRILTCLADHAQQLSLQCYEALSRAAR